MWKDHCPAVGRYMLVPFSPSQSILVFESEICESFNTKFVIYQGLCGTFNLNQKDDFLTPEGDVEQSAPAFANKWKTREFCDDVAVKEPENPCKVNVQNKDSAEKYCSQLKSKLFECEFISFLM